MRSAAGAFVLACTVPAHAVTDVDLGTLSSANPSLFSAATGLTGSFSQKISFSLADTFAITGEFSWRNRTTGVNTSTLSGFDAKLFTAGGQQLADDLAGAVVNTSTFGNTAFALAAGNYYILASGIGGGSRGGYFDVTLRAGSPVGVALLAAPVPEPANWAMLASGVLLIGTCASRRRTRIRVLNRIAPATPRPGESS